MVMILDPQGRPVSTKPQPTMAEVAESHADIVSRKINDLLMESLKDVCGGIVPSKRQVKKWLLRERRPDGDLFYWRGKELIFIANHKLQRGKDGKMRLLLPHRKLYLKTDEPLGPSN